jgi:hypothetical protein
MSADVRSGLILLKKDFEGDAGKDGFKILHQDAILIQKSIHADSIISKSNASCGSPRVVLGDANLRRALVLG